MAYTLRSTVDTWLKARPVQSASLQDDERTLLKARLELPLAAYRVVGDHLLVTLGRDDRGNQLFMGGRNTWYVYLAVTEVRRDGQLLNLQPTSPQGSSSQVTAPAPSAGVATVIPAPTSQVNPTVPRIPAISTPATAATPPVPSSSPVIAPTPKPTTTTSTTTTSTATTSAAAASPTTTPIAPASLPTIAPVSLASESVSYIPRGYSLRIKTDTWFKATTAQASTLSDSDRALVKAGRQFPLSAYRGAGNHLRFTLGQTDQGQQVFINGRNTWYVYQPAAEVLYNGQPVDATPAAPPVAPAPPPPPSSIIPQAAVQLIKEFEGYADELPDGRAAAYADPIYGWGVPTIGYGTTRYPDSTPVQRGDIITPQQAEAYLISHIDESARPDLEQIPTWSQMNSNQRSALYSFAYNLGSNFYAQPGFASITRVCDSPDRWSDSDWIYAQFIKYVNPGTSAEAGLRRRRAAEADLFMQ